ncbi:MAG: hypothetical protein CL678_15660 [Bdellovibrionaceae bacterium]|nr:hypothetical protein [Pseudobdellovibrionaceae bacterium]
MARIPIPAHQDENDVIQVNVEHSAKIIRGIVNCRELNISDTASKLPSRTTICPKAKLRNENANRSHGKTYSRYPGKQSNTTAINAKTVQAVYSAPSEHSPLFAWSP